MVFMSSGLQIKLSNNGDIGFNRASARGGGVRGHFAGTAPQCKSEFR
jgi:hypothetical protein